MRSTASIIRGCEFRASQSLLSPATLFVDYSVNFDDLARHVTALRPTTATLMGRVSDAKDRLMAAVAELFWIGSYDGTTIDQICEKAGVNKGSFYYFFEGKAALAEAALQSEWDKYRPQMEAIFATKIPPLERLKRHCDHILKEQAELKAKHGFVLGCPLCTLGTEISTQDHGLQRKVQEIMEQGLGYLETAIREAHDQGLVDAPNARSKASILHAYQLGLLTLARIENDLDILCELPRNTFALLGVGVKARRGVAV